MALSRKRDWYFHASIFWTVVWAILTLGTWPLLLQAYRFDRFRRLDWNQYHAFSQWLDMASGNPVVSDLLKFAEKAAGKPSGRWAVRFLVFWALAIAGFALFRSADLIVTAKTVFYPQSLLWPAIAFNAILTVAWFVHLISILRQQSLSILWLGRLNELLAGSDKRPVPIIVSRAPWFWLVIASAVAVTGPVWAAMMLVAIAIQNRYTRGTRAVRLAFLERMLEWMDTSGLPVEFDIEEIEPQELIVNSC